VIVRNGEGAEAEGYEGLAERYADDVFFHAQSGKAGLEESLGKRGERGGVGDRRRRNDGDRDAAVYAAWIGGGLVGGGFGPVAGFEDLVATDFDHFADEDEDAVCLNTGLRAEVGDGICRG
jgi:hypothetical protein